MNQDRIAVCFTDGYFKHFDCYVEFQWDCYAGEVSSVEIVGFGYEDENGEEWQLDNMLKLGIDEFEDVLRASIDEFHDNMDKDD